MDIQSLWKLSPEDFNTWRQENDLPQLLEFFRKELPHFDEWLLKFNITDTDFCLAPHTSQWFLENRNLNFYEYKRDGKKEFVICRSFEEKFEFLSKHHEIIKLREFNFIPYLSWGASRVGKKEFIEIDKANKGFSNTLSFGMWSGSRAYLLKNFQVLKLGQVNLVDGTLISNRNLDFVDLDGLTVNGHFHGSYATEINFSSCRNVKLLHAGLHHINFRNCVVDNFLCDNSKIQDFVYINCSLNNFKCSQSSINGLTIKETVFSQPLIDSTEIQRLSFTPQTKFKRYQAEADSFRRIRSVFQSIGKRHEAQKYYYLERCFERKAMWSPYLDSDVRKEFPNRKYAGRLFSLLSQWKNKKLTNQQFVEFLSSHLAFKLKVWCIPKYFIKALKYKFQYVGSLLSYLIWGYGLKVSRVLLTGATIILGYAAAYFFQGPTLSCITDSLYYSTVTFTTLGYGDILPSNEKMKLLSASEALLGAITMGLVIGVFSKKSDY